jgi:phosphatidate cytidylyltransferase
MLLLTLGLLFQASIFQFQLALIMLLIFAGYEWGKFINFSSMIQSAAFILLLLAALKVVDGWPRIWVLWVSGITWLFAVMVIIKFNMNKGKICLSSLAIAVLGFGMLVPSMEYLIWLKHRPEWLLYVLTLAWAHDIGGYLFGNFYGRHRMIPNISAKKSWEGFLGSFIFVFIVMYVWKHIGVLIPKLEEGIFYNLGITMMVICAALLGDTFESVLKRRSGLVDSGYIIPGHGGILDRIDSLFGLLPLMVLVYITGV